MTNRKFHIDGAGSTCITGGITHQREVTTARGVRWDDPAFRIVWLGKVEVISEKDRSYLDLK